MGILKESKGYHTYKRLVIIVLENNWTRRATKRDLSMLVGNTSWETLFRMSRFQYCSQSVAALVSRSFEISMISVFLMTAASLSS